MIAKADGIEESFEIEGVFFEIRHAQVVRNRAKSENQMVIGNVLRVFARSGRLTCQNCAAGRQIYSGDAGTNERSAVQAAAQRGGDVAGLEAAAGNLGKHRSEEESVCLADKGDCYRRA